MSTPNPPHTPAADRTASKVIAALTAALGAAVIVFVVVGAASPVVAATGSDRQLRVTDLDGVSGLTLDVNSADLEIVFDDVDEAILDARDADSTTWSLRREGDQLSVGNAREQMFSWFRGGARWFGRDEGQATLTLPDRLAGLDADLRANDTDLDVEGEFGALQVEVNSGDLSVTGEADTLTLGVSAASGRLELSNVSNADISLAAGRLETTLSGSAPDAVTAEVSAGALELTLPEESYDVTTDASAGAIENRLRTDSSAPRTVSVEVNAGRAELNSD